MSLCIMPHEASNKRLEAWMASSLKRHLPGLADTIRRTLASIAANGDACCTATVMCKHRSSCDRYIWMTCVAFDHERLVWILPAGNCNPAERVSWTKEILQWEFHGPGANHCPTVQRNFYILMLGKRVVKRKLVYHQTRPAGWVPRPTRIFPAWYL